MVPWVSPVLLQGFCDHHSDILHILRPGVLVEVYAKDIPHNFEGETIDNREDNSHHPCDAKPAFPPEAPETTLGDGETPTALQANLVVTQRHRKAFLSAIRTVTFNIH